MEKMESKKRGPGRPAGPTRERPILQLKIQRADVSTLQSLLPVRRFGRFYELHTQIRQEIESVPHDQYMVIPATRDLQADEKEQKALLFSVKKMLEGRGYKNWAIWYSNEARGFVIARKDTLQKMRNGGHE